jgi:hypothetical protein
LELWCPVFLRTSYAGRRSALDYAYYIQRNRSGAKNQVDFAQLLLALHIVITLFSASGPHCMDIKPENGKTNTRFQLTSPMLSSVTVLFSEDGIVKRGDFGLSNILEASQLL